MIKKTKKRNPADTTMRNINALKKRVLLLEKVCVVLSDQIKSILPGVK